MWQCKEMEEESYECEGEFYQTISSHSIPLSLLLGRWCCVGEVGLF